MESCNSAGKEGNRPVEVLVVDEQLSVVLLPVLVRLFLVRGIGILLVCPSSRTHLRGSLLDESVVVGPVVEDGVPLRALLRLVDGVLPVGVALGAFDAQLVVESLQGRLKLEGVVI